MIHFLRSLPWWLWLIAAVVVVAYVVDLGRRIKQGDYSN